MGWPWWPVRRRRSSWASLLILVVSLKAGRLLTLRPRRLRHLVLPALTLGTSPWRRSRASPARPCWRCCAGLRAHRAGQGTARGCVVAKHTLKNAAIPILTIIGLQFGTLLGGAVVTETVFAWPGMGRLAIQSIYNRDYPIVQAPCSCPR